MLIESGTGVCELSKRVIREFQLTPATNPGVWAIAADRLEELSGDAILANSWRAGLTEDGCGGGDGDGDGYGYGGG